MFLSDQSDSIASSERGLQKKADDMVLSTVGKFRDEHANLSESTLVWSVVLHLLHSFGVWLDIFSTRFECSLTSSPLVSSVV